MFNLKKFNSKSVNLLLAELSSFGININNDVYIVSVGDEKITTSSLKECGQAIKEGLQELKEHIWNKWNELLDLSYVIMNNDGGNQETLDNILFLSNVKKIYLLSKRFTDLQEISSTLEKLFNIDISSVHKNLIIRFNQLCLLIRLLHRLIVTELYRLQLLRHYQQVYKIASIPGPWSNLDLPMKERVWEWEEDEEFFRNKERSRKEQVRYNPELDKTGFFYVWQDFTRDPYRFDDMSKDSPYKSRLLLTVP